MFIELTRIEGYKIDVNVNFVEIIEPLSDDLRCDAHSELKLVSNKWIKVTETRSAIQNLINRSFK